MKTVTLVINNDNLQLFADALKIKGGFKAEYCKSKIYTTTVFLSRENGEEFGGADLFNVGVLFGGMVEKELHQ